MPPVLMTGINFEEFFVNGSQSMKLMSCFDTLNRISLPHCEMKADDYNNDNSDDDDDDCVGKLCGDTEQSE